MKRPEDAIQRACIEYLKLEESLGKLTFFHVPNGGKRGKVEAAIFKGLGVRPGVSDLVIVLPEGRVAFAELKAPGQYASASQKDFMSRVGDLDCPAMICKSVNELQEFLRPMLDRSAA